MCAASAKDVSIDSYSPIIGEDKVEEIKAFASALAGKSVCQVNSTAFGGGVAEILRRLVPLMRSLGLKAEWKVMKGSEEFFSVTKKMHNGLQGMSIQLTDDMKKTYLEFNEVNSKELDLHHDYVVVHDVQPAAIISQYKIRVGKWVWRCHIDLSNPNLDFVSFLTPVLFQYDSLIFTLEEYVPEPLKSKKIAVIAPSIDPLSPKNKPLSEDEILDVLGKFDVDPEKPILTQVSRFDPWKDPLGVIDVYRIVKKQVPDVQLLLIGSMARDDPEGWVFYEKTARYAADDYSIHLLTDWKGVGDVEVNAFQRASDVVLQKSIREGFGLSVSEALWKEVPVVGGNVGGIPLQIIDGQNGFLVESVQEAADKTMFLLKHVDAAKRMGKMGREHVRGNFLITRLLMDELKLLKSL